MMKVLWEIADKALSAFMNKLDEISGTFGSLSSLFCPTTLFSRGQELFCRRVCFILHFLIDYYSLQYCWSHCFIGAIYIRSSTSISRALHRYATFLNPLYVSSFFSLCLTLPLLLPLPSFPFFSLLFPSLPHALLFHSSPFPPFSSHPPISFPLVVCRGYFWFFT